MLRLFADDLEKGLALSSGKRVVLDRDPEIEAKVFAYVKDRFRIVDADGKAMAPAWVGMELDVQTVWIYLEIPMPDGWLNFRLLNRIFFDLFKDQVNTVNIKRTDRVQTLIFQTGDGYKTLPLG